MNNREKSQIVGVLNFVPTFLLTRKLVKQAGWKGSMLPGPNVAIMRQNKTLSAVYLGLMVVEVGLVLKATYDEYQDLQAKEAMKASAAEGGPTFEDRVMLQRIMRGLADTTPDSTVTFDIGDEPWDNDDEPWDDGKIHCEADHVLGGVCLTPLEDDGTCRNAGDHDLPAKV